MTLTLVFQIDGRDYGLEIDAVQEIIEDPKVCPLPGKGAFLKGVINVQGEVLPVVDLPALMESNEMGRDPRLIVLTPAFRSLALAVNRVGHIQRLNLDSFAESSETEADRFCRGVIERQMELPLRLFEMSAVFETLEHAFKENGGSYGPERDDCR
jgi:chemotaxis signal transduction protein